MQKYSNTSLVSVGDYTPAQRRMYPYETAHNEPVPKKVGGKKLAYFSVIKPNIKKICDMYSRGNSPSFICDKLGIAISTFYNALNTYSEFHNAYYACDKFRKLAVEAAAVETAMGYTKTIKKPIKLKRDLYENGKKVGTEERVEYVDEEIYVPANSFTQTFLLKNYMPDKYRDKIEVHQDIKITADTVNLLSTEDLLRMADDNAMPEEIIDVDFTEVFDDGQ